MLKSVLALGLLAVVVLGQPQNPPPPPPPPGSPRYGQGQGQGQNSPPRGGQPTLYESPEQQDAPMCPKMKPTGREWPCKLEHFEGNSDTPFETMWEWACLGGDMCYLGPVTTRPLVHWSERDEVQRTNVMGKRWFCGVSPCRLTNMMNGEVYPLDDDREPCTIGPEMITINNTMYEAFFFDEEAAMEMWENAEENMDEAPMFIPQVCRATSYEGEQQIRDCDDIETCEMGPAYAWEEGVQWKAFLCTKPPSPMEDMLPEDPKPGDIMMMMYKKLMMLSDYLAMKGEIRLRGVQKTIWYTLERMATFKNMYDSMMAKEDTMKKANMKKGSPLSPIYDELVLHLYVIAEQMSPPLDVAMSQKFIISMTEMASWTYSLIDKREEVPEVGEYMMWIKDLMEYFWTAHVETGKVDHPIARAIFSYQADTVKKFHMALEKMEPSEQVDMAVKKFIDAFHTVWNVMTDGPKPPGVDIKEAAMQTMDALKNLHFELMKNMKPEEIMEKVYEEFIVPLDFMAKNDMLRGNKDAKALYKAAHPMFVLVGDAIGRIPNRPREMEGLVMNTIHQFQMLWMIISGGPLPDGTSGPNIMHHVKNTMMMVKKAVMKAKRGPPPQPRMDDMMGGPGGEGRDRPQGEGYGQQPPRPGQQGGPAQRGPGQGVDPEYGRDAPRGGEGGAGQYGQGGPGQGMGGPGQGMGGPGQGMGGPGDYGMGGPEQGGPGQGQGPPMDFFGQLARKARDLLLGKGDGDWKGDMCPKQLWKTKMTPKDKMVWSIPDDAFFGDQPEQPERYDKRK